MNLQEELFTIQQVSTRLNIPKPTLRFWEKELNGILVPIRTLGKQRRYNLEHLALCLQWTYLSVFKRDVADELESPYLA